MRIGQIARKLRLSTSAGTLTPAEYWERRADELVDVYDHPETWADRGWMVGGVEEAIVPSLLHDHAVASVLVVGAGSGRQYAYLRDLGMQVRGFDISPTLVRAARARHPEIDTVVDDVVGAEMRHSAVDAVLSAAVLQHVAPERIEGAARAVSTLARRLIVIRELVWVRASSTYQWAHDYEALFRDWQRVVVEVTDNTPRGKVELQAFVPR